MSKRNSSKNIEEDKPHNSKESQGLSLLYKARFFLRGHYVRTKASSLKFRLDLSAANIAVSIVDLEMKR